MLTNKLRSLRIAAIYVFVTVISWASISEHNSVYSFVMIPTGTTTIRPTTTTTSASASARYHPRQSFNSISRMILYVNNPDDLKDETPLKKEERMKLVRQIQSSFYQDETENNYVEVKDDNYFHNVPLFRVQWTELLGFQNILNIHEPHYTHMFRRILRGPKPWRFGHLYLPEGSKNLNNPLYRLENNDDENDNVGNAHYQTSKATTIGTLMQISDVIEDEKNGRFGMIVQAIERFQVVEATQHAPYAMATVQLLPDEELLPTDNDNSNDNDNDKNKNSPSKELELWSEWEVRPTRWTDRDENGNMNISPLVNYNSQVFPDEISPVSNAQQPPSSITTTNPLIAELEYKVWVALDEMLTVLEIASGGLRIPVPSQLLGLLPTELPIGVSSWPNDFKLDVIAQQLQSQNSDIGTFTKSPFVRVSECPSYPALRRANRLSYAVWILLDSNVLALAARASEAPTQQDILELPSVSERLSAAYQQMDQINRALRK